MSKKLMMLMIAMMMVLFPLTAMGSYVEVLSESFEQGFGLFEPGGNLGAVVNSNNPSDGNFSANLAGGPYSQNQLQPIGNATVSLKNPLDLSAYNNVKVSFDYDFYSYDSKYYDIFSVDWCGNDGSVLKLVEWGGINWPGLENTGWQNYSGEFSVVPGVLYDLRASLATNFDMQFPSWGYIDDVSIFGEGNPSSPVPEPGTLLLFGIGVIGFACRKKLVS